MLQNRPDQNCSNLYGLLMSVQVNQTRQCFFKSTMALHHKIMEEIGVPIEWDHPRDLLIESAQQLLRKMLVCEKPTIGEDIEFCGWVYLTEGIKYFPQAFTKQ